MQPKIALQLWSIQEACQKDFKQTLKDVKKAGYAGVEFAGYHGLTAEEVKALLVELDLEVAASHIPYEKLANEYEATIAFEQTIGNSRIVVPYRTFPDFAGWQNFAQELKALAEKLSKAGFELYYHNHAHEFQEVPNTDLLTYLTAEVPALKLEVDTYWVAFAGLSVEEYLTKQAPVVGLLHIKEMQEDPTESTEIGKGILPIDCYVAFAKKQNLPWLIVEQEAFQTLEPLEAMAVNYQALAQIVKEC